MKIRVTETITCPHCGVGGFHYKGYFEEQPFYEEMVWAQCPHCGYDIIGKVTIKSTFEVASRTSRFNEE